MLDICVKGLLQAKYKTQAVRSSSKDELSFIPKMSAIAFAWCLDGRIVHTGSDRFFQYQLQDSGFHQCSTYRNHILDLAVR